jgi:hypothetical protein
MLGALRVMINLSLLNISLRIPELQLSVIYGQEYLPTGIFRIITFNKGDENPSLKMGYVYNTNTGGLWAGIKVLTATPFNHYAIDNIAGQGGVNMTDGYDESEKYTTLSTARAQAGLNGGGNDVIDVVSTGPFTLQAGDSVKGCFCPHCRG